MNTLNPTEPRTDSELLAAARAGDRSAFALLVVRYQQMVCALAFARTGSLAVSEDLAQETFLAAWRRVVKAGAPENFRAWLCGTVRNLAARFHRDTMPTAPLSEDTGDENARLPIEQVAADEDEALVWSTLAQMPEVYREPLVLYFRNEKSTREVAATLGITEVAARQRLSRGRALLQEAVRERVESALLRSGPSKGFAIAVMASISALTGSAQAAVIGAATAKGGSMLGGSVLAATATALSGVVVGFAGAWLGTQAALNEAESDVERRYIVRAAKIGTIVFVLYAIGMLGLVYYSGPILRAHPALWGIGLGVTILIFNGWILAGIFHYRRRISALRREERNRRGMDPDRPVARRRTDYRSRATFLRLPLIHVSFGDGGNEMGVARGWIAIGNIALSPFVAIGAVSVGGIAIGGVGVGGFAFAGLGLGIVAFCGLAAGIVAMGGLAIGYAAYGGLAWAWKIAMGGHVFAREFAVGRHAQALHANDEIARAVAEQSWLLGAMQWTVDNAWLMQVGVVLPVMFLIHRFRSRNTREL